MNFDEAYYGMRIDTFLADDPIAPLEDKEVDRTEKDKERLCNCMLELMNGTQKKPE